MIRLVIGTRVFAKETINAITKVQGCYASNDMIIRGRFRRISKLATGEEKSKTLA